MSGENWFLTVAAVAVVASETAIRLTRMGIAARAKARADHIKAQQATKETP